MVYVCIRLFIEVLFVIAEGWKPPNCQGRDSYINVGTPHTGTLHIPLKKKKKKKQG